jgi:hypothetical protein
MNGIIKGVAVYVLRAIDLSAQEDDISIVLTES